MELIRSLLNNSELNSFANVQVLVSVLIALLVYRVVAPVIDYFNPLSFAISIFHDAKEVLINKLIKVRHKKYSDADNESHHMVFGRTRDGMSARSVK